MSQTAIRVHGLGKRYRIGRDSAGVMYHYHSLRDSLGGFARYPIRAIKQTLWREALTETNSFWALDDLNFEIKKGEVVGIIGRNGAGKSTLLKVLSRITKPTVGKVELFGRVGSLLEVGTGFHPELSGRENIYLNGAILGMTNAEIRSKFDEIVEFSEVEQFLDTPVKQYSSGMYMRLAFAVAAHLEPEILVIDEVLAVGDAAFQKKCLGKISGVASEGRTVLIVSHQLGHILGTAQSAIWMNNGCLQASGPVREVVNQYQASLTSLSAETRLPANGIVITEAYVLSSDGTRVTDLMFNEGHTLCIGIASDQPRQVGFQMQLSATTGEMVGSCCSPEEGIASYCLSGRNRLEVRLPASVFLPGEYSITLNVWESARLLYSEDRAVTFTVLPAPLQFGNAQYCNRHGLVRFAQSMAIRQAE